MEKYDFMHCPSILCDYKLTPPWENYCVGTKVDEGEELPLYKCPFCGFEFTANTTYINSVPVEKKQGFQYVLVKKINGKTTVAGVYYNEDFVEVAGETYLHIPKDKLTGARMFIVPDLIFRNRLLTYIRKGLRQVTMQKNLEKLEQGNEKTYSC